MAFALNSSGDMQADRRFAMAMQFHERGDYEAAADLLVQARELAPAWPPLSFRLGEALAALDRKEEAAEAFRAYLALDPADRLGAIIKLALLGAAPAPETLPASYVESLFDDYAPRFDAALVERLSYKAPQLLAEAVEKVRPAGGATDHILDLGCGTGLAGDIFRARAAWLEGVDLSAGMIAVAEEKGAYDKLHQADILTPLALGQTTYDLVLAADVLVYIGDLDALFSSVQALLAPGGVFAFTTQLLEDGGRPFILNPDHRYAHSAVYLRACAAAAGLQESSLTRAILRQDGGRDVHGYVGVFRA